jgi:hypothetical protein
MADKLDYAKLFDQSALSDNQQVAKKRSAQRSDSTLRPPTPNEIGQYRQDAARSRQAKAASGGLLSGLTKKPAQSGGFLVTEKEDADLRGGKTPAGWSKGKDGRPRPMVQ